MLAICHGEAAIAPCEPRSTKKNVDQRKVQKNAVNSIRLSKVCNQLARVQNPKFSGI